MERTRTGHDRGEPGSFRCWNAAEIEMVNERSQSGETPVSLQSEAGDEHLEGDF